MTQQSTIFLVSDRTGITVENLAKTLISQFNPGPSERVMRPFVNSPEKTRNVVAEINAAAEADDVQPMVFCSLVDYHLLDLLKQSRAKVFDIFETFMPPMSEILHQATAQAPGRAHGMGKPEDYDRRVAAVNFALRFDDGQCVRGLDEADLILLGVSRCGKTPTCLYLAMQYKVLAANFPLTEQDFLDGRLPEPLKPYRDRLFGLTIAPERLHQIREERRPGSTYASLGQCRQDVSAAEALYKQESIPCVDSTKVSIEELAVSVMQQIGVERSW